MKKVLLIYGGSSPEHNISCESAKCIIENIDQNKYLIDCVYITPNNVWLYQNKPITNIIDHLKKFDVVFPITHGTNGEDGKLQGCSIYLTLNMSVQNGEPVIFAWIKKEPSRF